MIREIIREVIKKTLKVPVSEEEALGNGIVVTRQLDTALVSVGFKLSGELLEALSRLHPAVVKDIANNVLSAVRELVGDHVKHNVYFIEFPNNVPNTLEFWTECIADALCDPDSADKIAFQLMAGQVNLLDLPKYGKFQHSYEDMLAVHEELISSAKDRITVLHLGKRWSKEALDLYHSLAESSIPLNESDRELLEKLAKIFLSSSQPENVPIRENKAVINLVRLNNGYPLIADTPTDVLRLACALSDGDVTLQEPTKFKSFPRKTRRILLAALDDVIKTSPAKLADIGQYCEEWKRLGERLHPYEYKQLTHAQDVFAVARGDKKVQSLMAKVELAFMDGNITKAIELLSTAPGMLFRNLDRILRSASEQETEALLKTVEAVIPKVSGRVILSLREHLQNRTIAREKQSRIFANSRGTAWVIPETREPLSLKTVKKLFGIFDEELIHRMSISAGGRIVANEDTLDLAVPLSDKNKADGFGVLPRGSILPVPDGEILRFFMYWKQTARTTDYDLSALLLDKDFQFIGHVSWTNYGESNYAVYSGDIISAPNGASEFIDIDLSRIADNVSYIIPQVHIYSGENFEEVKESFFGFMTRTQEQMGEPFEARTVRMKSELRGKGKVVLPLVFIRDGDNWFAKSLNLCLNGKPNMNCIEENKMSTTLLARSIVEREYLRMEYLIDLMRQKASLSQDKEDGLPKLICIYMEAPEGLSADCKVYALNNLQELIPA